MAFGTLGFRVTSSCWGDAIQEWELSDYGCYAFGAGHNFSELVGQSSMVSDVTLPTHLHLGIEVCKGLV